MERDEGREGWRDAPLPSRPANSSSDVNREYQLAEKVSYVSEQGKWRARLTGMNPFQSAAWGCYGLDSRKREILSPARWQKERERGRNREGEGIWHCIWRATLDDDEEYEKGRRGKQNGNAHGWSGMAGKIIFLGSGDEGIKYKKLQRRHARRGLLPSLAAFHLPEETWL